MKIRETNSEETGLPQRKDAGSNRFDKFERPLGQYVVIMLVPLFAGAICWFLWLGLRGSNFKTLSILACGFGAFCLSFAAIANLTLFWMALKRFRFRQTGLVYVSILIVGFLVCLLPFWLP